VMRWSSFTIWPGVIISCDKSLVPFSLKFPQSLRGCQLSALVLFVDCFLKLNH